MSAALTTAAHSVRAHVLVGRLAEALDAARRLAEVGGDHSFHLAVGTLLHLAEGEARKARGDAAPARCAFCGRAGGEVCPVCGE